MTRVLVMTIVMSLAACCASAEAQTYCENEQALKSRASEQKITLEVRNASGHGLRLYWINFEGKRQYYQPPIPADSRILAVWESLFIR